MISVEVKLDAGLGQDLDNFTVTAQPSATQLATLVSRANLLFGVTYANVPDASTDIDVTSTGLCTNEITLGISLAPVAPADVINLVLVENCPNLDLTWDAVVGVDVTYNVYRSVNGTTYFIADNVPTNAFTGTGVTEDLLFYYKIKALEGGLESLDFSNIETGICESDPGPVTVWQQTLIATDNGNPVCATTGNSFFKYSDVSTPAVGTQFYNESPGTTIWTGGDGNWWGWNNGSIRLRIADGYVSGVATCF